MRRNQRGAAIVLAMGVVALAAVAAAAIMVSQTVWSRQSQVASDYIQAQVMVEAGVDWMRAVLRDDGRMSKADHLGEPWAQQMPRMPIENGELTGAIDDQQGLFNLNNLVQDGKVSVTQLVHFKRLLDLLGLPDTLAHALVDWLDADTEPQPHDGAEDEYYRGLNPPYLAANRPLTHLAELGQVRGFDGGTRVRLHPFVTALPRFTAINVNTAPPEVLVALTKNLGMGHARALAAQRDRIYIRDQADFLNRLPEGADIDDSNFGVTSDYFLVRLGATVGGAQAQGVVLLDRTDAGWPAIVWRQ